jgi:small GTP-binding protein
MQDPTKDNAAVEKESSELKTFTTIGGSPVPGLTLRRVLRGHKDYVTRMEWSPDGSYLASPSSDKTVQIWNTRTGGLLRTLTSGAGMFYSVAWSKDGSRLASASGPGLRVWEVATGNLLKTLASKGGSIWSVAWSPNGEDIAASCSDSLICLWYSGSADRMQVLAGHKDQVTHVAWSPDGRHIASGSGDNTVRIWEASSGKLKHTLNGHRNTVINVCWLDNQHLVSASADRTIRLWDTVSAKTLQVIEGHSGYVNAVTVSSNKKWLASRDAGGTTLDPSEAAVRLWRCDTWECVAVFNELGTERWFPGIDIKFHPHLPLLATLGEADRIIRIWELDEAILRGQAQENVHYTTAKLVLVGDSGVGKTGLGWRLAHDEFKEQFSTHGQQFWPIQRLGFKRKDGTECEAVLWDLAGQHVYRPIHSIFLENVAAALVVFDPSNRQDPLKGVQFWLEQLKGKGELPPAVLVGARVDRGAPAISRQELDQFCQRYGIRGGYISTSALKGEGLDALVETLKEQIPWDAMSSTVTSVTFKRIKDYVLELKEKPDRKGVLVSPSVLREQLEATDRTWQFTETDMMTAVGHLETHGYVAVLRNSAGDEHILLRPELLVTLAASIVLLADKHPRELGAVSETEVLQGKFDFEELAGLEEDETLILIDAAIQRFMAHNICFRQTMAEQNLLIFPVLIKQKRPLQDDVPSVEDVSYVVRGRVENLYPSLVVLLGYTPSFTRINQWQNQAQYEMGENEICGFRLVDDRDGEIEVVLYYGEQLPPHGRSQFQRLFEQFLYQRQVDVTRFPPVICPKGHRQERATIMKRVREGKQFVYCEECGAKTDLPSFDQPQTIGIGASRWLQGQEASARLRSAYEVELTKVKSYRRDWAAPRCYMSRVDEQPEWTKELVKDLRDAGVYVVEQAAQVEKDDFVVVLDTRAYEKAFKSAASDLAGDIPLVNARLGTSKLISLGLTGQARKHTFEKCKPGWFCDETHYPLSLFDLVLNLYGIPLTHAGFAPLREAMHAQWEQTLAVNNGDDDGSPLKIFISYAHEDEEFKDALVTMLTGLQRRGVIDAWEDRRISPGDEWHNSIQDAMNDCDVALLLVSPDYIASRFIHKEEQPKLLKRRQEMQLRVIPIIIRPCQWQSEPVLKDLQVLPRDGKPIIKFSEDNGDRDQAWTDIADVIEQRAKARNDAS